MFLWTETELPSPFSPLYNFFHLFSSSQFNTLLPDESPQIISFLYSKTICNSHYIKNCILALDSVAQWLVTAWALKVWGFDS